MKALRLSASFGLHLVLAVFALAYLVIGKVCALAPLALGVTTLTTGEILADVMDAFKTRVPALNRMGTDFVSGVLKLNQTYTAHIAGIPTVSSYDTTTGYANGATAARGLLTDVPVTVSNHPTCPLKWLHLDNIKDKKREYTKVIGNAGYALAKDMIDDIGTGLNTRNFTNEIVVATANFDYDELMKITGQANGQGMMSTGRTLLVNTAVANVLFADERLISKDYSGQLVGGDGIRRAVNVGGFAEIIEWPEMPSNNVTALTGVTGANSGDLMTKVAHGLQTGDPVTFVSGTSFTGLTAGVKYFAIRSSADTFQVALTYAAARAGTAVALSADGTSGVFQLTENLSAFCFDARAIAIKAGIPEGFAPEVATALGVPQTMSFEALTDTDPDTGTGLTMAAVAWQQVGTGDFYWCPTFVWGASLGKQTTDAAAAAICDKAGLRVVTA